MTSTLQAIASTTSKLRALLQESRKDLERLQTLQTSLTESLEGLFDVNDDGEADETPAIALASDDGSWKETVSLVATGRVLGLAAQAEDILSRASTDAYERGWVADGKKYARWLANGVVVVSTSRRRKESETRHAAAQLLGKGMGIGYPDQLVAGVTQALVVNGRNEDVYHALVNELSPWEQRQFLTSLLPFLEEKLRSTASSSTNGHSKTSMSAGSSDVDKHIGGAAALLLRTVQGTDVLEKALVEHILARPLSISLMRTCIAALPIESQRTLLERSWNQFGDKLCIKHKPIAQQESNVRLLLLLAGRIHRSNPMDVFVLARSSHHGTAISDRLASSSERVRWLGMIVATAVSKMVDKQEAKINFSVDTMKTEEAKWYLSLTGIADRAGSVTDLVEATYDRKQVVPSKPPARSKDIAKPTKAAFLPTNSKIIEIVSDDSDDDLQPYGKPDSDASDSEEDATLVDRKKPKAPVYIRTLLSMLSDNDNFAAQQLALSTAPSLIRRKADFGSELKDQAEDLAHTLISMQDSFDMDEWHDMRQAALVALVAAQPRIVGPWCANSFFTGDHSIAQRATLLTAMGLAGRELAGFGSANTALMRRQAEIERAQESFPTKRLPGRLHQIYGGRETNAPSQAVDVISRQLEQTLLRPVATKQSTKPKTKTLRNDLASLVGECFFFPLTGGWSSSSMSSTSGRSSFNNPTLMSLLVKTLAILLSAAGRTSPHVVQMTSELWTLLLTLGTRAMKHQPLMEAVLFAMLAILDLSDAKYLAKEQATLMIETQNWVSEVWEKLEQDGGSLNSLSIGNKPDTNPASSDSGQQEVERCKYLAAGVLVKIKEITDEYQRVLLGDVGR